MNIKQNKNIISLMIVHGIVLLVFTLLFLLIPFPKRTASWILFGFSVLSVIASLGISLYAMKGEGITSKVYGLPMLKVGYLYLAAQLMLCVILCLIAAFVEVPYWIPLLLSILLLAAAALGVITTDRVEEHAAAVDTKTKQVTRAMKNFRLDISSILDRCTDAEVRRALEKLADDIRYSDPVSGEATADIERDLDIAVEELRVNIRSKSTEELLAQIAEVRRKLAERNRICKASK